MPNDLSQDNLLKKIVAFLKLKQANAEPTGFDSKYSYQGKINPEYLDKDSKSYDPNYQGSMQEEIDKEYSLQGLIDYFEKTDGECNGLSTLWAYAKRLSDKPIGGKIQTEIDSKEALILSEEPSTTMSLDTVEGLQSYIAKHREEVVKLCYEGKDPSKDVPNETIEIASGVILQTGIDDKRNIKLYIQDPEDKESKVEVREIPAFTIEEYYPDKFIERYVRMHRDKAIKLCYEGKDPAKDEPNETITIAPGLILQTKIDDNRNVTLYMLDPENTKVVDIPSYAVEEYYTKDDIDFFNGVCNLLSEWDEKKPFTALQERNIERFISNLRFYQYESYLLPILSQKLAIEKIINKENEKHNKSEELIQPAKLQNLLKRSEQERKNLTQELKGITNRLERIKILSVANKTADQDLETQLLISREKELKKWVNELDRLNYLEEFVKPIPTVVTIPTVVYTKIMENTKIAGSINRLTELSNKTIQVWTKEAMQDFTELESLLDAMETLKQLNKARQLELEKTMGSIDGREIRLNFH